MKEISDKDIENVLAILEDFGQSDTSRLKLNMAPEHEMFSMREQEGIVDRQYHHGRCDVGSPWACGTPFDVLEDEKGKKE